MSGSEVVLALMLAASANEEPKWELKSEGQGVKVYSRSRAGSEVREIKSVGEIPASAPVVFRALTDFEHYKEMMPYTEESKVVATEEEGGKTKVWHFYTVIGAPMSSRRDYTLRVVDESDWNDGKGTLKTHWVPSDKGPSPKKGVVRVAVNEGSWILEPIENGTKTRATYRLFTDPGGSLPTWISNMANSTAIPDVFAALRKAAKDPRYAEAK